MLRVGADSSEGFPQCLFYPQLQVFYLHFHFREGLFTCLYPFPSCRPLILVTQCLVARWWKQGDVFCCSGSASVFDRCCVTGSQRWRLLTVPTTPTRSRRFLMIWAQGIFLPPLRDRIFCCCCSLFPAAMGF